MTASDDLFELIQSLTPAEKRYFKIFAQQHRAKDVTSIKLFDAIEKQHNYDEQQLKDIFKKEKFIRHFAVLKIRLQSLILKSLHYFNSNQDSELGELLHHIEILFEKGLRDQCRKILEKIKRIAEENENYPTLFAVMEWEEKMMIAHADVKVMRQRISEYESQTKSVVGKYVRRKHFKNLLFKIGLLSATINRPRNKKELDAYDSILNDPLLKGPMEKFSEYEKELSANIHCNYYLMQENYEGAYPHAKDFVSVVEGYGFRTKVHIVNYIKGLNNLMACQIGTGRVKDLEVSLGILRNLPNKFPSLISENIHQEIINTIYIFEFGVCERQGDFKKGLPIVDRAQKELSALKMPIKDIFKVILYYNFAHVFFGTEDYSSSKVYLNKIISEIQPSLRTDIYALAKTLLLIVNFEQRNYDTLEYITKSTRRFLSTRERLFKIEIVMMNFFKTKVAKARTNKELQGAFQALKEKIIKLKEEPLEKAILDSFDFISWIDSKIENRSFAEIVREKAKAYNK